MITQPVHLAGERVTLRELSLEDWPAIHAYASLPEVCRFQPWGPNTPEKTRTFVEQGVSSAGEQPRRRFVLAVVPAGSKQAIGMGELNIRNAEFRTGEIAYVLQPQHWGQGLGTEMAGLLLDFGFGSLHLHRIYATCDPRNVASARVMEKIGMLYEGRMREVMLIRDGWRDSDLRAILEGEWQARRAAERAILDVS